MRITKKGETEVKRVAGLLLFAARARSSQPVREQVS